MANSEHVAILKQGAAILNEWKHLEQTSNRLRYLDFAGSNLAGIKIRGANLRQADFTGAILRGADFRNCNFHDAKLMMADLTEANLRFTSLVGANLSGANLTNAYLTGANFYNADLSNTDFSDARMEGTNFGSNDLSNAKGLTTVFHFGPSAIGVDTLYKSAGNISPVFLRNCGVPDDFITYLPSLIGTQQALQFYSCFISYSHKDEDFVKRLHSRMWAEHLRVWYAPEDIKGGEKLGEQIDRAIQIHDRLLLILSENSLHSEWVMTEIRKARKIELKEKRQKLFPIRLVSFQELQNWECLDADTGRDLAVEVREYFIPDFSNWKDHDAFEATFAKLVKDLRTPPNVAVRINVHQNLTKPCS